MRHAAVVARRLLQRLRGGPTALHLGFDFARPRPRLVHGATSLVRSLRSSLRGTPSTQGRDPAGAHLHQPRADAHLASRRDRLSCELRRSAIRLRLVPFAHPARLVPIAAALLLVVAVVGGPFGSSPSVRGGSGQTFGARVIVRGLVDRGATDGAAGGTVPAASPLAIPAAPAPYANLGDVPAGVLATPIAAPTNAPTVRVYTVAARDTLTTIASRFGLSAATIYWANADQLPDPAALHLGQQLVIPAVNGIVIVVQSSDTLETLALRYSVLADAIAEANDLTSPALSIGQTLVIPGVGLAPIPTPTPPPATPRPTVKPPAPKPARSSTSTGSGYVGGRLAWPVAGRISQRFSSYHPALDIAAPYGTSVVAAAAGTVVFAGWRSYSGGGNVIWISHGGGLYTTYNHLSGWSVRVGQSVGRGQRIGAVGTSGVATGPHLHFEVWTRYPWAGGSSAGLVNPCRYLGC